MLAPQTTQTVFGSYGSPLSRGRHRKCCAIAHRPQIVMAGLDPAIHVYTHPIASKALITGSSPVMTIASIDALCASELRSTDSNGRLLRALPGDRSL